MGLTIVATHDNCILLQARVPNDPRRDYSSWATFEYFLYEMVGGAVRRPSLSLLPGCYISRQFQRDGNAPPKRTTRFLAMGNKGLLRRGDDEVLVAQLEVTYDDPHDTTELCVLRTSSEWELIKKVPIVHMDGGVIEEYPEIDVVVPRD